MTARTRRYSQWAFLSIAVLMAIISLLIVREMARYDNSGVLCQECVEPVYVFTCPGTNGQRTLDWRSPTISDDDLRFHCAPLGEGD